MSRCLRSTAAAAALALLLVPAAVAQQATAGPGTGPASTLAARTGGMERQDGFIPIHWDGRQGRLYLEIPRDSMRSLLWITQATGLGSNPVGIDRGANAGRYVVRFDRVGDRVLVVLENTTYRSSATDHATHVRSVAESFPHSTIASLPLLAVENGRLLVDATEFVIRDWTDVAGALQSANQGSYSVARDRSTVNRDRTRAFPRNTEIDIALTFTTSGRPGNIVSSIAPDGRAITMRQHLSLVELPDDGYQPRVLDPRIGFFGITFRDFAQRYDAPLEQRWIARHRLQRENPNDQNSPIRNPIVYYIDPGIPEPLRTATIEGAKFWEQAFDQAGLRGGFVVRVLPDDADPMDARYNVVQWVNRNERGWSIGGSLGDPRTGEIMKGMARMDSHRNRTSYAIYAALMGTDPNPLDTAFVLGRVRQVTAHEIGHTIGIAHNYIASTSERSSVMDYPPPRVRLDERGEIDLSAAYDVGPGTFDVWAIRWAYGIFPRASEADSLRAIAQEGLMRGFLFLSDNDARPEFASDPRVNLWDDGADAFEFLRHQVDVRRVAIRRFGERNIAQGEPLALLQERFATVYFFHRFALNSAAKAIGGMEYHNAMRGDGQQATRVVDASVQRRALGMLAMSLRPAELAIPDTVLTLLGPRPFGYPGSVELFSSRTRPAFDEFGAAHTLATMILDGALQRDRMARVVQFAARDPRQVSLGEVIDTLVNATWTVARPSTPKLAAIQRTTQRALAERMLALASDTLAAPDVRAFADMRLAGLRATARQRATTSEGMTRAHWRSIENDMDRWLQHRELPPLTPVLRAPPGDPFGDCELE